MNSHNLFFWLCMDIVRRKLMLVTSGAYRVKKLICTCIVGKRLSMIMYPQIHKPLCCYQSFSFTWCIQEKLCMNGARVLLRLYCMLLGYNFNPTPHSSVMTIGLSINEWMLPLKKPVWWEQTTLTRAEIQAAATSEALHNSGRTFFSPSWSKRRQKEEALFPARVLYTYNTYHVLVFSVL